MIDPWPETSLEAPGMSESVAAQHAFVLPAIKSIVLTILCWLLRVSKDGLVDRIRDAGSRVTKCLMSRVLISLFGKTFLRRVQNCMLY